MAKKRIIYAVHGHGRGHAVRARAVLPAMMQKFDIQVLSSADAYNFLKDHFPIQRIPNIAYQYNDKGRRHPWKTIMQNLPGMLDFSWHGPAAQMIERIINDFKPDMIISDSEPWTHHVGKRLGIPRISFDHYGLLITHDLEIPANMKMELISEAMIYDWMMPKPDMQIVVGFFSGKSRRPNAHHVGTILRQEVFDITPADGDYLLAYFTQADKHFKPNVEAMLKQLRCPVKIYGPDRTGMEGNCEFRKIDPKQFLLDLAGCKCVFSTAGNQLCSEALHYGKPLLVTPEKALEQRINAHFIQNWGVGASVDRENLTLDDLDGFISQAGVMAARIPQVRLADGRQKAIEMMSGFIEQCS